MYRFSIGAIIKNEIPYILEWISYHLSIGVEHFYIADNCSDDGQYQLLQLLSEMGFVTLLHQENLDKGSAQVTAYNKIIEVCSKETKSIAFIDGDEFIAINDFDKFNENLNLFLDDESFGAMALNWRTFGSSGKQKFEEGLVIERFTYCGNSLYRGNWTIKTISKPGFVERQLIHHANLKKGSYKHISLSDISFEDDAVSGPRINFFDYSVAQVNHYVIKSKEEFVNKKMTRGCANRGKEKVKFLQYFDNHDVNDECISFAPALIKKVRNKIKEIEIALEKLGYYSDFTFKFDRCEGDFFSGWVKFIGINKSARLRVLVDGVNEYYFESNLFRPKLFELNGGEFGNFGFHFKLPRMPKVSVEISVVGNIAKPILSSELTD